MIYPGPKPNRMTGMRVWGIYSSHGPNSHKQGTNWDTSLAMPDTFESDRTLLHPVNSDQNYDYIRNSGLELRLDLLNIFMDYPYAYGLTTCLCTHMLTSRIVDY